MKIKIKLMNYILNNDLVIYSLCSVTICLVTGYFIKSYLYSVSLSNQTPNSPPTFNFTLEELKQIEDSLDNNNELDQETKNKLDHDFKNMLGEEHYEEFTKEMQDINTDLTQQLQDIFNDPTLFL
jgi:RAB protein geranylgeranyltransferase component A